MKKYLLGSVQKLPDRINKYWMGLFGKRGGGEDRIYTSSTVTARIGKLVRMAEPSLNFRAYRQKRTFALRVLDEHNAFLQNLV